MIETALAFARKTPLQPEENFKAWQGAGRRAIMRLDPEGRTAGPIPTFGKLVSETAFAAQSAGNSQAYAPSSGPAAHADTDEGFGFDDVLDIINPLQHIPVTGSLYRKYTGDTIKPMGQILGGAIFGGPVGAVAGTVNAVVQSQTGKDVAENMLSLARSNVAPAKKPELIYQRALPAQEPGLPGTTLAMANLSAESATTQPGETVARTFSHRNFAAPARAISWNS